MSGTQAYRAYGHLLHSGLKEVNTGVRVKSFAFTHVSHAYEAVQALEASHKTGLLKLIISTFFRTSQVHFETLSIKTIATSGAPLATVMPLALQPFSAMILIALSKL